MIRAYPHDANSFTEGLEYRNGVLYESSGLYGQSTLRKEDLKTGKVTMQVSLPGSVFGEGFTVLGDRVFQVTWQSQIGFFYQATNLARTGTFHYTGEGWAMTNDGRLLYLSDGTSVIRCLDPRNMSVVRTFSVHDRGEDVKLVNELEWVKGQIYANIWHSDRIARIDPKSGSVTAWIDLKGLKPASVTSEEGVLNGIAYDPASGHLLVTGKLWPKLFEIEIVTRR